MSILSKIVHAICDDLYPKVASVVAVVAEDVAAVAEEVSVVAEHVAQNAEELADRLEPRVPKYGAMLEKILDAEQTRRKAETGEKLDWRHSIVDTLKLTGVDSSPENRARLAEEFGFTNYHGTAQENIELRERFLHWLRSQ